MPIFTPDTLHDAVDAAVKKAGPLPAGHDSVLVFAVVKDPATGQVAVKGTIATKFDGPHGSVWQPGATFDVDHSGHIGGGAELKISWPS